jgi:hypothetical protein
MTKPTGGKHPVILRDKATNNHAIDSYGYGRVPHLFFVLANQYPDVPVTFLLTLFFLWDKTVGTDAVTETGDCALSQIPVRRQEKVKWLAALVVAGFFTAQKPKSGGANQDSTLYEYKNPTADEWDVFFHRAEIVGRFPNWDSVSKEEFSKHFADVRNHARRSFAIPEMIGRGLKPPSPKKKTETTVRLAGPQKS